MSSRISLWCETQNVIAEAQAGFRRGYTTIDNCFTLMAIIQKYLTKKRGRFYCIFVDFAKAFDSIQHQKLWDAFARNNINGKILLVLKSMYSKLKSCVKGENQLSTFFKYSVGTRQGCVEKLAL